MRPLPICLLTAILLPAPMDSQSLPPAPPPSPPPAQSAYADNDEAWDRLTLLSPQSKLAIQTSRGTIHCQDQVVTDDGLSCERHARFAPPFFLEISRPLHFQRSEVLAVRERHPVRIRWIGYGSALVAGFAVGAMRGNSSGGEPRALGGLAGSALFGLAAIPVVEAVATFSHGNIIYSQTNPAPNLAPH